MIFQSVSLDKWRKTSSIQLADHHMYQSGVLVVTTENYTS